MLNGVFRRKSIALVFLLVDDMLLLFYFFFPINILSLIYRVKRSLICKFSPIHVKHNSIA